MLLGFLFDGRAPASLPLGPEQLISTTEELFHFSKMLLTSSLFFTYRTKLRLRDFSHYSLCTILKKCYMIKHKL